MGNNLEHDVVEIDSKPLLQTGRVSLEKHYQSLGTSDATRKRNTTEQWREFAAKKEHWNEPIDAGGEVVQVEAAVAHD